MLKDNSSIQNKPTIFLAGPTDRTRNHTRWRREFVKTLAQCDKDRVTDNAILIIPEFYSPEISWEEYSSDVFEPFQPDPVEFFPTYIPVNLKSLSDTFPKEKIYAWERNCLRNCDILLFWVDRDMEVGRFALTTNIEFGNFYSADKYVICGSPKNADKVDYMKYVWEKEMGRKWYSSYEDMAEAVIRWFSLSR